MNQEMSVQFFVLCFIHLLLCLLKLCVFLLVGGSSKQTARSRCRYMDACVQICLDLLW